MADRLASARTITLWGSVLTSLSAGTNYVYSAYAPQLASRLHITHTQLNVIGLSGNVGVNLTGPIFGRLADRLGPRPLLMSSLLLLATGYMSIRIYYDAGPPSEHSFPMSNFIVLSMFSFMTGAGGSAGLQASANATAKSFPERMRATTIGLVFAGFGLSAFFFSTLANWMFPGDTSALLLLLSLGTAVLIIIGLLTIRPVPHAERPDVGPGGLTLWKDSAVPDSSTHLLGPEATGSVYPESDAGQLGSLAFEASPLQNDLVGRRTSTSRLAASRPKPVVQKGIIDVHGKEMLLGWEFWLLFTLLSLLSGTGLTYINNVGSISQALSAKGNPDYDRGRAGKIQAAQVSIISLANCIARVVVGAAADFAKNRLAMHRSYLLSLISAMLIVSQIVGSHVEDAKHLWQASVLLGLGYGGTYGLLPTITIEWFGLPHFSENWGFVAMAAILGGNVFSIFFGRYLDAHVPVHRHRTPAHMLRQSGPALDSLVQSLGAAKEHQCLKGRECYAGAMATMTFACTVALILSLIAAWRDRRRAGVDDGYEAVA